MAYHRLTGLSPIKSFFVEFIFKPLLVESATILYPLLMWASPIRTYRLKLLVEAGDKTSLHLWGDTTQTVKMKMLNRIFASFLEADNAYSVYFFEFMDNYRKTLKENGLQQMKS